ncbi:MAG: hypothetical protein Q9178_007070 [Gyalolechia marmorata]
MPMPTKDERLVWIDLLANIRAIYLPVAWSVSKDHPDLCSFVQVNFALSRTVKFWHGEGHFSDVSTDQVMGLRKNIQRTLALDVTGLIQLLKLPQQLRKDNCYRPYTSQAAASHQPPALPECLQILFRRSGPQLALRSQSFIKNVLTVGIGFVPTVGPILQIMFAVGWTLVGQEDPEAAFTVLEDLAPRIDLTEKIIGELKKAASETRLFLPDGWKELNLRTHETVLEAPLATRPVEAMDAMLRMLLQKEAFVATGNNPDEETPMGSQDAGETLVDNAAGELMDAGKTIKDGIESALPDL